MYYMLYISSSCKWLLVWAFCPHFDPHLDPASWDGQIQNPGVLAIPKWWICLGFVLMDAYI